MPRKGKESNARPSLSPDRYGTITIVVLAPFSFQFEETWVSEVLSQNSRLDDRKIGLIVLACSVVSYLYTLVPRGRLSATISASQSKDRCQDSGDDQDDNP